MNFEKVCATWRIKCKSSVEKFVLCCLAGFANGADRAWPSISSICERTQLSERAVQKAIRSLEASGFLRVETSRGGRYSSNQYVLLFNPAPETPYDIPRMANRVSGTVNGAPQTVNGAPHAPKEYRKSTRRGQAPLLNELKDQRKVIEEEIERLNTVHPKTDEILKRMKDLRTRSSEVKFEIINYR